MCILNKSTFLFFAKGEKSELMTYSKCNMYVGQTDSVCTTVRRIWMERMQWQNDTHFDRTISKNRKETQKKIYIFIAIYWKLPVAIIPFWIKKNNNFCHSFRRNMLIYHFVKCATNWIILLCVLFNVQSSRPIVKRMAATTTIFFYSFIPHIEEWLK